MEDKATAPLNYFLHAYGPAAQPTLMLGWIFTAIVVAVCVMVGVLLLVAILKKRPEQNQTYGSSDNEGMRWVMIGSVISTAILFGMAVYALVVLNQSAAPPREPALTITVTGYDWWWKADYDGFTTANEIHIPVGVPVRVVLKSADVIHSFWVPELAGKTEMIPGLSNQQWLEADRPGTYRGQCTQFCGLQHAHMAFDVIAESPADFAVWENAEGEPTKVTATTAAGHELFQKNCASCHTVRGTDAAGLHGPDLTHLMSRPRLAAGLMPNTPENLANWVAHPQELKPGVNMPDFAFAPDDASALSAYLATLR